jgi:integrase/recombinase XerD
MKSSNGNKFAKLVHDFLMIYLPRNKCFSPNTQKAYRETLNLLREFLETENQIRFSQIQFDMFNRQSVRKFIRWLQDTRHCAISTINQRLAILKSFLYYCATEAPELMMVSQEVKSIKALRTTPKTVEYLSKDALKIIFEQPRRNKNTEIRNLFFMILLYDTGARIQELLDLRLSSFHLSNSVPCVYLVGKGNKLRAVPVLEKTVCHLQQYLKIFHSSSSSQADDLLFYSDIKGVRGMLSPDAVACFLKRYAKMAHEICPEVPLNLHPHLFRHTRAMHLYQSGIPLSYIKDFLGHVSVETTSIYAYADLSMLKEALESARNPGLRGSISTYSKEDEDRLLQMC